ncbi:hypothetical protein GCM10011351_16170 [Paraliobacillus quinghaiensis]|uniref:RNA polymerase subunit sigma-70 n=1 Tax=Paraliobacillus quinghaiensis TaxID=470815 RepID=A0A917TNQ5_9BACI|nr:hypothetical protein [Paraliobacillus quinghaiensis]GGM30850.1 hypothetical protein GCM10011351_16170 [Paraliobacillus quinghaiensis]
MRINNKQLNTQGTASIFGANFHRFVELESFSNSLEIAEELGISLHDVKKLKEKLNRS